MKQRPIKYRAWDKANKQFFTFELQGRKIIQDFGILKNNGLLASYDLESWQQLTGLTDRNGKEIWELNEVDGKYRVIYQAPSYVLQDISSGDILPLYDNTHEVTGEYSPMA